MTTRREVIAAGLAAGALPLLAGRGFAAGIETGPATPFSFDALKETARDLATQPYAPPVVAEAALLESIDYDLHNQISYREEATLWGDVPGVAELSGMTLIAAAGFAVFRRELARSRKKGS